MDTDKNKNTQEGINSEKKESLGESSMNLTISRQISQKLAKEAEK